MTTAPLTDTARDWLKRQMTGRAVIGLSVLLAVLAAVGLSELAALNARLDDRVRDLRREHQLQTAMLSDGSWSQRAEEASRAVAQVEAQFWSGSTTGIAAAELQGSIEAAARAAEVRRPRVQVQSNPEDFGPQAVVFDASLNALDPDGQFLFVFQELARADGFLLQTSFKWNRRGGQLEMRMAAPAIIGQAAPQPDQEAAP